MQKNFLVPALVVLGILIVVVFGASFYAMRQKSDTSVKVNNPGAVGGEMQGEESIVQEEEATMEEQTVSPEALACEQAGGQVAISNECDGTISEVCNLGEGNSCYAENVVNGQCEGEFTPKVLCDVEQ